jgi:AcrR family transcriptional regulator
MASTPPSSPPAAPVEAAPATGLAASQLRRMRRIVDEAVTLAEREGFDGVRLRDVAEASGVALGTLYKYFRSKEDILLFAANEEAVKMEEVMCARPPQGDTAIERVTAFFARSTRGLTRRPDFARAVIRAIAAGDPGTAANVAGFHLRTNRQIVAAIRGEAPQTGGDLTETAGTERERALAMVLNHVWFATLIGWSGGLHPVKTVTERVHQTALLLLPA